MNKNHFYTLIIVVIGVLLTSWLLFTENNQDARGHDDHGHHGHGEHADNDMEKGPNGGRLLHDGEFALEVTVFEKGVPPEFHVYAYHNDKPIDSSEVSLQIQLTRLDSEINNFVFTAENNYLRGDGVVTEPHSFDVHVEANYQDTTYNWRYENYEGRVQIDTIIAAENGIATKRAGAHKLREILKLTGRIQIDPNRLSQVRARYPGVVKKVQRELGEQVKAGDVLAQVQSNDSLQIYSIKAPIAGVIVQRDVQPGETTGDAPLFVIADLSKVWAELDIFNHDISRVHQGQAVMLETLGDEKIAGYIDWISPMAAHSSQSLQARVVIDNKQLTFRPGQFIRGHVTLAEHEVPLAVKKSAIQSFRDFQVVFAKVDNTYEVRMLDLGRDDGEWVEVLGGLKPGTEYVTKNSYLIKADIEKSGASHDH